MKKSIFTVGAIVLALSAGAFVLVSNKEQPAVDRYGDPLPEHALLRLGTLRFRPVSDSVSALSYSPDGKLLASVASGYTGTVDPGIQIWDVATGQDVGPEELRWRDVDAVVWDVHALAWAPDSRRVVVCLAPGSVEVWDVVAKKRLRTLSSERSPSFRCLAWSRDGKLIAAGQPNISTVVWDAKSGDVQQRISSPASCLDFSPDGKTLAAATPGMIRLHEVSTGKLTRTMRWDGKWLTHSIAFSPDGALLGVSAEDALVFEVAGKKDPVRLATIGKTLAIAFSPDGKSLRTGDGSGWTQIWDTKTFQELHKFGPHTSFASAFSPNGKTLAISRRRIAFADPAQGSELERYGAHAGQIARLALSPDGKTLYSAGGRGVRVWDTKTSRHKRLMRVPGGSVRAVAISHDGRLLAAIQGTTLHLLDAASGKSRRSFQAHDADVNDLMFVPSTDELVTVSAKGVVKFWQPPSYDQATANLHLDFDGLAFVDCAADGSECVVAHLDIPTQTSDVSNVKAGSVLIDLKNKSIIEKRPLTLRGTAFKPLVKYAPGAKRYTAVHSLKGPRRNNVKHQVRIHDRDSGKVVREFESDDASPSALDFTRDGRLMAVALNRLPDPDRPQHVIRVYSVAAGDRLVEFRGHLDYIRDIRFSPDGKTLYSASQDSTILAWDVTPARRQLQQARQKHK